MQTQMFKEQCDQGFHCLKTWEVICELDYNHWKQQTESV